MGKSEGLEKRPVFQFILESEYRTTHRCLTPTRTGTRDWIHQIPIGWL